MRKQQRIIRGLILVIIILGSGYFVFTNLSKSRQDKMKVVTNLFEEGLTQLLNKNYDKCISSFEKVLFSYPEIINQLFDFNAITFGSFSYSFKPAVDYFKAQIANNANDYFPYYSLGILYTLDARDFNNNAEVLREAMERGLDSRKGHYLLGLAYLQGVDLYPEDRQLYLNEVKVLETIDPLLTRKLRHTYKIHQRIEKERDDRLRKHKPIIIR